MMDLPGREEANKLGYTLAYHSGDRKMAVYQKDEISLTVELVDYGRLRGELGAVPLGIIKVHTGPFSFPNINFGIFERQVKCVLDSCKGKEW